MIYDTNINKDPNLISIDRVNSDLGYSKNNVVLSRWVINHVKNSLSKDEFLTICKQVTKTDPRK